MSKSQVRKEAGKPDKVLDIKNKLGPDEVWTYGFIHPLTDSKDTAYVYFKSGEVVKDLKKAVKDDLRSVKSTMSKQKVKSLLGEPYNVSQREGLGPDEVWTYEVYSDEDTTSLDDYKYLKFYEGGFTYHSRWAIIDDYIESQQDLDQKTKDIIDEIGYPNLYRGVDEVKYLDKLKNKVKMVVSVSEKEASLKKTKSVEQLSSLISRFDRKREIAESTSRINLSSPLNEMDDIITKIKGVSVENENEKTFKDVLLEYGQTTLKVYLLFMKEQDGLSKWWQEVSNSLKKLITQKYSTLDLFH